MTSATLLHDSRRTANLRSLVAASLLRLSALFLALLYLPLEAEDVLDYTAFKIQAFTQTNPVAIVRTVTNGFYFESQIYPSSGGVVGAASVLLPDEATEHALIPSDGVLGYVGSRNSSGTPFSSLAELDASFPDGAYTFTISTLGDGTLRPVLNVTGDSWPASVPQVKNFAAAQAIAGSNDFTLSWFGLLGATANDYVSLSIAGTDSLAMVFHSAYPGTPGALEGTSTSAVVPAGTLADGRTYTAHLRFAKVSNLNSTGYPGALGYEGYSYETYFNMTTVGYSPAIAGQPQSQTAVVGSNAVFSVSVTGTAPFSYQWQSNGVSIAAATDSSYTVVGVKLGVANSYDAVVRNLWGAATSQVAVVTVVAPPGIAVQPSSQTVVAGSNITFDVFATGSEPLSFQWWSNGVSISGATGSNYTINAVQPDQAGGYSAVVTNSWGAVTSLVATLTVALLPSVDVQPQNQTVVAGSNVTFSVSATGTQPLTYHWQFGGVNIAGATDTAYTVSSVMGDSGGDYNVVVTNPWGSATSQVASLTILVPPSITIQPLNQTVALNANATFSVVATGTAPLSCHWELNGLDIADAAAANYSLGDLTNSAPGCTNAALTISSAQLANAGNYRVIVANSQGSVTSRVAVLTIDTMPPPATPSRPRLALGASNGGTVITFPVSAFYLHLETTASPVPDAVWTNSNTPLRQSPDGRQIEGPPERTNGQQFFRLRGQVPIPVVQFAVFYNGLLEFSTCPTMSLNGPVHANGAIYTGSLAPATFNGRVTTTLGISSPTNNGQGSPWIYTGSYNGNPASVTNVPPLLVPGLGTNDAHAMIDMPPLGESPVSMVGQNRLFNQAQAVLLVSNANVTLNLQISSSGQVPGADPSPISLVFTNLNTVSASTNLPFLTVSNTFTDQRENKTVLTTQLDVGKYGQWIKTNASVLTKFPAGSGTYPTILYVADNRTVTGSQMTGVRLIDGVAAPANGGLGFSVATPDPLYVVGHYNCTNAAYLGTTNTSATVPCALMSDALTILSGSWSDGQSANSYTARDAADTTVNAALLTGNVPSTGSGSTQFSGGVHNLPRLLEDWSGNTLTLNTSIINLFTSTVATQPFVNPGTYYSPPTRKFSYDFNFLNPAKQPPGMPSVWPAQ